MAKESARARAVHGGHRRVTTKFVRKVELLNRSEPLQASQRSRLNVINQQLEGKLNMLSDMDKDILSRCELDTVDTEIEESEAVVAKIINCKQQRKEATNESPAPRTVSTAPPLTAPKPRLPKLVLPKFKGDVKNWTAF